MEADHFLSPCLYLRFSTLLTLVFSSNLFDFHCVELWVVYFYMIAEVGVISVMLGNKDQCCMLLFCVNNFNILKNKTPKFCLLLFFLLNFLFLFLLSSPYSSPKKLEFGKWVLTKFSVFL